MSSSETAPLYNDRLSGGADVGLDFARLAGGQHRVHAGSDGGKHPVEFELEAFTASPCFDYFDRFGLRRPVRGEDGGNGGVDVVMVGEGVEPGIDGRKDSLFAHHVRRRMAGHRRVA